MLLFRVPSFLLRPFICSAFLCIYAGNCCPFNVAIKHSRARGEYKELLQSLHCKSKTAEPALREEKSFTLHDSPQKREDELCRRASKHIKLSSALHHSFKLPEFSEDRLHGPDTSAFKHDRNTEADGIYCLQSPDCIWQQAQWLHREEMHPLALPLQILGLFTLPRTGQSWSSQL